MLYETVRTLRGAWDATKIFGGIWIATQLVFADYTYQDRRQADEKDQAMQEIAEGFKDNALGTNITVVKPKINSIGGTPEKTALDHVGDYLVQPGRALGNYLYERDHTPS